MMSIYIKGMEMPNTCEECNLESFCNRWIEARIISGEWKYGVKATMRHPDCPLIPVPEHGRLIDADELMSHGLGGEPYKSVIHRVLIQAPTIIPADKEVEG